MSKYEAISSIIAEMPISNFRLILGIKISDNLFRIVSYFDSENMDFDLSMNSMCFSVEDKFLINNFDSVLYEESINKHFFDGKRNHFAIGQNIIFRNNIVGFIYVLLDKNTKYDNINTLKDLFYEHLKSFLTILLDMKDEVLKEYSIEQTINSLFSILKAHDAYTYYHSLRIADLSVLIAENLKLDQKNIEKLYYAALIHDLGEIWIPKEILQKSEKLTPVELEIIKQHTNNLEFLFAGNDYFSEYVEIAKYHHEYLDGSGYSKKNKYYLSLLSKILVVSEVTDALLSNRPWRKAMKIEDAPKILFKMVENNKLDGEIVKTVVKIIPDFYGGLLPNTLMKYNDVFINFNIEKKEIKLKAKIIDSKKDFINIFLPQKTIEIDEKNFNIEKDLLQLENNISIEYYSNNNSFNKTCTIVGKNKTGYILKINKNIEDSESVSVKWNLIGVGVPLKKVVFVNKYVWRLDNEKAFKINIESISNKNLIFYALKDKVNNMVDSKILITFEAMNLKINLIGEIIYKEEIFSGYYHCDFKIGEVTDDEYTKLIQIINLRKEQLKMLH
ncbi:HD domain-containing protein [Marinitoga hydrogenitolerans DSM 16785]|uniref:HD domain-containing protein n=1 Tax=Marinitoga hydrogenitolerans (strain DSM 16785 / JCM 12826 / AT1271) TaxID=1122195 RepID=A0A1M4UYE2_MARH1|nr:HD domain-containing phosphohydrolase [Marinitoga hydrogenitolerans]SHE61771.1 HD domain-containing protein [Marinitoga hydrogenitolerans DSM 16785]